MGLTSHNAVTSTLSAFVGNCLKSVEGPKNPDKTKLLILLTSDDVLAAII